MSALIFKGRKTNLWNNIEKYVMKFKVLRINI